MHQALAMISSTLLAIRPVRLSQSQVATDFFVVEFDLIVTPTSSDAPFSFSWSQTTATGDNTYVFAGSFVELKEVL
jgi:hypothetical protein